MSAYRAARRLGLAAGALVLCLTPGGRLDGDEPKKGKGTPWTFDEVMEQLAFHPKDPYLQYVALQLGAREGRQAEVVAVLDPPPRPGIFGGDTGRRSRADLFSTFTGALAVQESLQLDTMRGQPAGRNRQPDPVPNDPPAAPKRKSRPSRRRRPGPGREAGRANGPEPSVGENARGQNA